MPDDARAERPPGARQGGQAGSLASESAGMDVREQDPPRAELVELVHQPLGAVARHHRADRDPALPMEGAIVGPSMPGVSSTAAETFACSMS